MSKAQTVLLAAGVVVNDELAARAGLEVRDGIVVNDVLLTSDPNISALGDCCRFTEPLSGQSARLESVQAATDHARAIAARLMGRPTPYKAIPWFWSNQQDQKLQIAGFSAGAESWEVASEAGKFTVFCFENGQLAAVETINNPGFHMAARMGTAIPAMPSSSSR